MKKYLINGLLAIVAGGFAASCADHDVDYVPLAQQKAQAYDQAFKEMIGGNIDPNQNWGFEVTESSGDFDPLAAARSNTRSENANANEWADPNKEYGGLLVPPPLTDEQIAVVKKYFQTVPNITYNDPHWTNYFIQQVYKGHTDVPEGCATPEAYKSADNNDIIASDHMDHLAAIDEGNNIFDHINNFNHGDCSTNSTVLDNGGNANDGPFHSDKIMYMMNSTTKSFGYYNSDGSLYHNEYTGLVNFQTIIDVLGAEANCLNDGWNRSFMGFDFEQMVGEDLYARELDYQVEGGWNEKWGPEGFPEGDYKWYEWKGVKYHVLKSNMNMYAGDLFTCDDTYIQNETNVDNLLADGYLPVDGGANKKWVKVGGTADGYFSDWIVTLTEAEGGNTPPPSTTTTTTYHMKCKRLAAQGRVFCEDLGQAGRKDIDFNDIVFDARIWWTYDFDRTFDGTTYSDAGWTNFKYEAEICLLAAGGTITSKAADNDVHSMFGVGVTTMVNTFDDHADKENMVTWGDMAAVREPVTFTYDMTSIITAKGNISLDYIPIEVLWTNDDANYGKMQSVGVLNANLGQVPHKICAPIGTVWPSERRNIKDTYPNFEAWATDRTAQPTFHENPKTEFLYTGNTTGLPLEDAYGREYFTVNDGNIYTNYTWEEVKDQTTYAATETILWSNDTGYAYDADGNGAPVSLTLYSTTFNSGDKLRVYGSKQDDNGRIIFQYYEGGSYQNIVSSEDQGTTGGTGYFDIPINDADKASHLSNGPTLYIAAQNFTITKIAKLVVSQQ